MTPSNTAKPLEILSHYRNVVWPQIDKELTTPNFPKEFAITEEFLSEVDSYWKIAREYPERKGKYLRPTILILTCLAMGEKLSLALNTAAAMQLSEEWILVHDDFEDKSITRRGLPSLNIMYPESLAVNAADGLHVVMWHILRKNFDVLTKNVSLKIMDEFHLMLSRTIIGQNNDISFVENNRFDYSDSDWFFIADSKTGYYTIAGPIRLGAILAGANKKQIQLLTKFGLNLGRCFQLIDDLLDVTSDFSGLKQKGNDVYESKRTLILGHLLRTAKNNDLKRLQEIISKPRSKKTEKEVQRVIEKMHECGSIKYAKSLAKKYKKKAENILDHELDFLNKEPHRAHLKTLMTFVLERDH